MRDYVTRALDAQAAGTAIPFAVVLRSEDVVVGSTRYAGIAVEHDRLEIGWTWYGLRWQRTAVNTECKLLLLRHAFDVLGAFRVELKTDALNARSRAAILRIRRGNFRRTCSAAGRRDSICQYPPERWPMIATSERRLA
jgi:RimJ/RimL family protein N-acetyltransferase